MLSHDTESTPSQWWFRFAIVGVLFLVQFAVFSFLAFHRLIDGDEGLYLYVSKLVFTDGIIIYKDVFYQQTPLLPYFYGAWMWLFGYSWEAGRSFSALLAAGTGTMLVSVLYGRSGRISIALSSLLLYAMNISVLLFFLTAKTYVLSTTLLFASVAIGYKTESKLSGWMAMASGLLLALCVQVRLFFAVAVPIMAFWFWFGQRFREKRPVFWYFAAGFAGGMIPSLIFLSVAPTQFVYDNLLYHGMRDPAGLIGDIQQKIQVATKLILSPGIPHPTQLSFLLCAIPLVLLLWKRLSELPKIATALAFALGFVSFLPTPSFGQYFCVLVPFLTLALGEVVPVLANLAPAARKSLLVAFSVFSIVYAAAGISRIDAVFIQGKSVPGVDSKSTSVFDWRVTTVKQIAQAVESNTDENSLVVSSWPGYLLTIDRKIFPKMENQMSLDTAGKLSAELADKFRMLREEDLVEAISEPDVQTIVAGNCTHRRRAMYHEAARQQNYELVTRIGNTEIFSR